MSSTRRPLKSLGQNFLIDNNIIDKIIQSAALKPDDYVLEIGPGRGALTEHLVRLSGRLVLIEYDHALAAVLKERYADQPQVTVVDADILAVDLADAPQLVVDVRLEERAVEGVLYLPPRDNSPGVLVTAKANYLPSPKDPIVPVT